VRAESRTKPNRQKPDCVYSAKAGQRPAQAESLKTANISQKEKMTLKRQTNKRKSDKSDKMKK
jgi:hypothetical protein